MISFRAPQQESLIDAFILDAIAFSPELSRGLYFISLGQCNVLLRDGDCRCKAGRRSQQSRGANSAMTNNSTLLRSGTQLACGLDIQDLDNILARQSFSDSRRSAHSTVLLAHAASTPSANPGLSRPARETAAILAVPPGVAGSSQLEKRSMGNSGFLLPKGETNNGKANGRP